MDPKTAITSPTGDTKPTMQRVPGPAHEPLTHAPRRARIAFPLRRRFQPPLGQSRPGDGPKGRADPRRETASSKRWAERPAIVTSRSARRRGLRRPDTAAFAAPRPVPELPPMTRTRLGERPERTVRQNALALGPRTIPSTKGFEPTSETRPCSRLRHLTIPFAAAREGAAPARPS
jgi:hypothetical protein